MRVQWTIHSSITSDWTLRFVLKIYHNLRWFNWSRFFPQVLVYLNNSWITSRSVRALFGQRMPLVLLSGIWKLFSAYLLRKLSVIVWDALGSINKESVISNWRFRCSYLIINLNVKLVKLLMLLIILLWLLRRDLLLIYKLLLLFRRNHVPILLADHLVTLNPLMLLGTSTTTLS